MIHIVDSYEGDTRRQTLCGLPVPGLPEGDRFYFASEGMADVRSDCPVCNPNPRRLGTPISELSGRPGEPGFERFRAIGESWGYD